MTGNSSGTIGLLTTYASEIIAGDLLRNRKVDGHQNLASDGDHRSLGTPAGL